MSIFFISDLHLNAYESRITQLFYRFTGLLQSGDQLYILGDFFNAWVGDDAMTNFDRELQSHLQSLTRKNISIYMLYGNRDFLMRDDFFKHAGVMFLEDESIISLNGTKTLLMHGDSLCSDDRSYLRYKRIVRNPLVQRGFLALPKSLRYKIARKLRKDSEERFDRTQLLIDVNQQTVLKAMSKYHVSQLIHGHTHLPGIHHFTNEGNPATRIVLGAWHEKGSVLKCSDSETLELMDFP